MYEVRNPTFFLNHTKKKKCNDSDKLPQLKENNKNVIRFFLEVASVAKETLGQQHS